MAASSAAPTRVRHAEAVMGTVVSFDLRDPRIDRGALAAAVAWLHHVDATFSTYRPDSVIRRLDRGELSPAECDDDVREVLALCEQVADQTDGWFSVDVGGGLDPSGLVKGWAVERACRMLTAAGSASHGVNAGGDVRVAGEAAPGRPWHIAVAHPAAAGRLVTVVRGTDLAVATSGTGERGRHVIDPKRRRPADALLSVTLVGASLTMVDACATAAFAMGDEARDWLEARPDLEGFAVTRDGRCWWSSDFPRIGLVPS